MLIKLQKEPLKYVIVVFEFYESSYYNTVFFYRQAYIEFANKESSLKAKHLNESLFRGRQLTVEPKRKNIRGMSRGGGFPRGRGNPRALFTQFMSLFGRGMGFRGGYRGARGGGFRGGRGRGGPPGAT